MNSDQNPTTATQIWSLLMTSSSPLCHHVACGGPDLFAALNFLNIFFLSKNATFNIRKYILTHLTETKWTSCIQSQNHHRESCDDKPKIHHSIIGGPFSGWLYGNCVLSSPSRTHTRTRVGDEREAGRKLINCPYRARNMKNIWTDDDTSVPHNLLLMCFHPKFFFSISQGGRHVWKCEKEFFRSFGCFANKTTFTLFYLKELYFVYLFIIKYFVYDVLVLFFI